MNKYKTRAERRVDENDPNETVRNCWECGGKRTMWVDGDLHQAKCLKCGYFHEEDRGSLPEGKVKA